MAARSRRRMALVAVAALCMGVPACGRSVSSTQGQGQGSGIVSPTTGLVATTPAGTKPVQSVVWRSTGMSTRWIPSSRSTTRRTRPIR